jgi:hypothetical protein
MMRANTNQAKKQLKPTHVHSIKKEPHKKERDPAGAEGGLRNKSALDTKEAFGYKVQREAKKKYVFFFLSASPLPLWT